MISWQKCSLVASSIVIILVLIGAWLYFDYGLYINTASTAIQNIEVKAKNIELRGTTDASSTGFSGYKYNIQGDSIYIRLRYCLVSKIHPSGNFDIKITGDNFEKVNNVYLQGEKNDTKLIWHK